MIRTLFWNDGTFCIVDFDSYFLTNPKAVCRALGKELNDLIKDIDGHAPYYYLWNDKGWVKNSCYTKQKVGEFPILALTSKLPPEYPKTAYREYFLKGKISTNHRVRVTPRSEPRPEKRNRPTRKKVNVKIHWLYEGTETILCEEHDKLHKTISDALYNGGYSQAAVHSIKHWSIEDSDTQYKYNKKTYKWEKS